jgi:hypothetical protein
MAVISVFRDLFDLILYAFLCICAHFMSREAGICMHLAISDARKIAL